jgi:hypothetical protein
MAIISLHWIWQLIESERRSAVRSERRDPPLMKIEPAAHEDRGGAPAGLPMARSRLCPGLPFRRDRSRPLGAARSPVNGFTLLATANGYVSTKGIGR